MKKIFYIFPLIMVVIIGLFYYQWSQEYKKNLDWFTAYNDYLSSGCEVCFEYFENIDPEKIPALESEFSSAIIQQVAQAHTFYTDETTSQQQREENKRVEKLILLFIKKGANINYFRKDKSGQGYTTLYATAQEGNPRLVKFLLEHGADPSIADTIQGRNMLPIDIARQQLEKFKDNPKMQIAFTDVIDILSVYSEKIDGN